MSSVVPNKELLSYLKQMGFTKDYSYSGYAQFNDKNLIQVNLNWTNYAEASEDPIEWDNCSINHSKLAEDLTFTGIPSMVDASEGEG